MPVIKYVEFDGSEYTVEVAEGANLMQGALDNMIEGIIAECGGGCVCCTCHCIIDPQWKDAVGNIASDEDELLEMLSERQDNSRLSCQVTVTASMEGMVVRLPESQY